MKQEILISLKKGLIFLWGLGVLAAIVATAVQFVAPMSLLLEIYNYFLFFALILVFFNKILSQTSFYQYQQIRLLKAVGIIIYVLGITIYIKYIDYIPTVLERFGSRQH